MMSAIVFDLDGTLVHSAPDVLNCLADALSEVGLLCVERLPESIIGPPIHEMLLKLSLHCSPAKTKAVIAAFRRRYDASPLSDTHPYDGAIDLLQHLVRSGHLVYLATNKPSLPTQRLVERSFPNIFSEVCCIDSVVGEHLSKTAMLQLLSAKHALLPGNTLMVGDGIGDMIAGRALGWTTVAVAWGYGLQEELNTESPDHRVESFPQLQNLLSGLLDLTRSKNTKADIG